MKESGRHRDGFRASGQDVAACLLILSHSSAFLCLFIYIILFFVGIKLWLFYFPIAFDSAFDDDGCEIFVTKTHI